MAAPTLEEQLAKVEADLVAAESVTFPGRESLTRRSVADLLRVRDNLLARIAAAAGTVRTVLYRVGAHKGLR